MIFIKTDNTGAIYSINFQPFHGKYGLKKTEDELLQEGYLVEVIPEAPVVEGKQVITKYIDGKFTFEYESIPLTEIDLLKGENLELKLALAEMAETQEAEKLETQLALAELAEAMAGGVYNG